MDAGAQEHRGGSRGSYGARGQDEQFLLVGDVLTKHAARGNTLVFELPHEPLVVFGSAHDLLVEDGYPTVRVAREQLLAVLLEVRCVPAVALKLLLDLHRVSPSLSPAVSCPRDS